MLFPRSKQTRSFSRRISWILLLVPLCSRAETAPPNEKNSAPISINVFGLVKNPGAYPLPKSSTLLDALTAAGWGGDMKVKVFLLRGPAGKKPVRTPCNLEAIFQRETPPPTLEDRDSILVEGRIF